MNPTTAFRVAAIDVLRAFTMLLMIFVNDLWSLTNIPGWLEHVPASADGMGLADIVFPGFLFIVGMSVPFAIRQRQQKGDSAFTIAGHIAWRGAALLLMGVFLVNGEYINETATGMSRGLWNVIACTAFILIWNQYPATWNKWLVNGLKLFGAFVLFFLAFRYRGGEGDELSTFSTWWWGILGLIGWAYIVCALYFLVVNGSIPALFAGWLLSLLLCAANHSKLLPDSGFLRTLISPIGEGSMTAFTIGGAFVSQLFWKARNKQPFNWPALVLQLSAITLVFLVAGLATRPIWGISKIRATPSWVLICSAISIVAFLLIYWITDIHKKADWFKVIRPAGTETLLCYLIPYYAYALIIFTGWSLPAILLTGAVGLLKSAVFALLVVLLAGLLTRKFLKLRL